MALVPLVFVLAFCTFISTLVGGLFALRFNKSLPYFFAFSAGSLIAISFFELLPESMSLGESAGLAFREIALVVVASFLFYHLIERFFLTHHHDDDSNHAHVMGPIGAGSLVVHSFFDGAAIGAAFQINAQVGLIVAMAVLFHDFTDGINTVTLMLKNKHKSRSALAFLVLDALAPSLGVLFTALVSIHPKVLSLLLAFFVGEFIYIGAANLLPETRKHPSGGIVLCTVFGVLLIYFLTALV